MERNFSKRDAHTVSPSKNIDPVVDDDDDDN